MHPTVFQRNAMHPTIFELNAFGRCRLPGPQGRAVLRHLRGGCASCRAALSAHLMPWLDDEPAAEARGTDPRRHGEALVAEHLRAAARAFRAAAKLAAPPAASADVDRALALLAAEGPAAIGRMPRRLLGPAAVEALLQLTSTLGGRDRRLRLRFAELACDLAHRETGDEDRWRDLRCRSAVELANAHRVVGDLRLAQEELDRVREELLRGPHDRLVAARLLVIEGLVMTDRWHFAAAQELLSAAARIYRRRAQIQDLVQAFGVSCGNILYSLGRFDDALYRQSTVLQMLDREREPLVVAAALHGMCGALLKIGRCRDGLDILRRERTFLAAHFHGEHAAKSAQLEGRLLYRAGDIARAARSFAACRGLFESEGSLYRAGIASLYWAAALEERGDWDGSLARIMEGTELIMRMNPGGGVYKAAMLLRTAKQFSATRDALPLARVIEFLYQAESNPDARLQSFLA